MVKPTFFILLAAAILGCADAAPSHLIFNRLYVFGDSYSDSGAGYVDGNGPTAVVYMARALGIPFTWAGAPDASGKGLNYAVSAAQTGLGTGRRICPAAPNPCVNGGVLLALGMRNQVDAFLAQTRDTRITWRPARTLFFIAGGLNDGALPTQTTLDNLSGEILDLHAAGARNFLIATLPTRIPAFSQVGMRLNPALRQMVEDLSREFPDSAVHISQWGQDFDDIILSPGKYGLTDVTSACAKRAIFGEDPTTCKDPAAHFFYHEAHPSTRVHDLVGEELAREVRRLFSN